MVAEGIPGQLPDGPVVLVQVRGVVGEDQVGVRSRFERLEPILDGGADEGEIALAKGVDLDLDAPGPGQQLGGGGARFRLARGSGGEDHPAHGASRVLREQAQDGSAAADLQVVAMRSQAEQVQRTAWLPQRRGQHQGSTAGSGIGTMNFAPHARACESCATISSLKFQGRMRMKSGRASSMRSGAWMGIRVPGRNLPCL